MSKVFKCDICGKVEPRMIRRFVMLNPDVRPDQPLNKEEIYAFNIVHGDFCYDCMTKLERMLSMDIYHLQQEEKERKKNEEHG